MKSIPPVKSFTQAMPSIHREAKHVVSLPVFSVSNISTKPTDPTVENTIAYVLFVF